MWLLAQTHADRPVSHLVIEALSQNGLWIFVAICVLSGTAVDITKRILRYKERMAMIEAGLSPDDRRHV